MLPFIPAPCISYAQAMALRCSLLTRRRAFMLEVGELDQTVAGVYRVPLMIDSRRLTVCQYPQQH